MLSLKILMMILLIFTRHFQNYYIYQPMQGLVAKVHKCHPLDVVVLTTKLTLDVFEI